MRARTTFKNLANQRFGMLLVLEETNLRQRGGVVWKCRCDCGLIKNVVSKHLHNKGTKSCGCLRITTKVSHGHAYFGKLSPTYQSWRGMNRRCRNPNQEAYKYYGGKGVTVCDRWNLRAGGSFESFLADMGERPEGTTLGRFGDIGNYSPENCKWMTNREQVVERARKRQSQKQRVPAISETL